ncbi:hypothetical protein PF010_g31783, partial [Phytophthora fragariae]
MPTSEPNITVLSGTETPTPGTNMAKTNIPETAMPEVPTIEVVNAETPMSALPMAVALDLRMTNPSMRGVDSSDGEGIAEWAAMNTEESGLDAFYCDQFIDAMR